MPSRRSAMIYNSRLAIPKHKGRNGITSTVPMQTVHHSGSQITKHITLHNTAYYHHLGPGSIYSTRFPSLIVFTSYLPTHACLSLLSALRSCFAVIFPVSPLCTSVTNENCQLTEAVGPTYIFVF